MTESQLRTLFTDAFDAARFSPDRSVQNGAVLATPNGDGLVASYNHIPQELQTTDQRLQRPQKYAYTAHAELSVICIAARQGIMTNGTIMVCTWAACEDCARAIIMSGITKLITHAATIRHSRPEWTAKIDIATAMLAEAGVAYEIYQEELGLPEPIRFNGEELWV